MSCRRQTWLRRLAQRRSRDIPRSSRSSLEVEAPRCPVCRHPLVARVDCRGPYFYCGCPDKRSAISYQPVVKTTTMAG